MTAPAYDPHAAKVGDPVPIARQAEVLTWAAKNWWPTWNYASRTREKDADKHFDLDAALHAGADTLRLVARLCELGGETEVMGRLRASVERLEAQVGERGGRTA